MEQAEETKVYRISTRQLTTSLMAVVFTLSGTVSGLGYYIASDFINTSKIMGKSIKSLTAEVRNNVETTKLIRATDRVTASRVDALFEAISDHNKRSEVIHDRCGERLASLETSENHLEKQIRECMRNQFRFRGIQQ